MAVAMKNSCVGLGIMNRPLAEPRAMKAKISYGSQVRVGLNRNNAKANLAIDPSPPLPSARQCKGRNTPFGT